MKAIIEQYTPFMRGEVLNMKLREQDIEEVKASNGLAPVEALKISLDVSDKIWVARYKDKIIAVFGRAIHPEDSRVGIAWLLGTDELSQCRKSFMKYSYAMVQKDFYTDGVELLMNFVSRKNFDSMKWLAWLGFSFDVQDFFLNDGVTPFKRFIKWRRT